MLSLFIRITFMLLVLNQLLTPCAAFRGYGRGYGGSKGSNKGYKETAQPKTIVGNSAGIPSSNTPRRGLGISAWGLVTVIVVMILAGTGFYYFTMCYPILCKKSRKYDMIGLANV